MMTSVLILELHLHLDQNYSFQNAKSHAEKKRIVMQSTFALERIASSDVAPLPDQNQNGMDIKAGIVKVTM